MNSLTCALITLFICISMSWCHILFKWLPSGYGCHIICTTYDATQMQCHCNIPVGCDGHRACNQHLNKVNCQYNNGTWICQGDNEAAYIITQHIMSHKH